MVDNINALLARGVGPALVEGTHAGFYAAEANQKAEEERRRQSVQGDIPAAMKGDADALGRVVAGAPKEAQAVVAVLSRMDANQQAKVKAAAEYAGRAANAVLQADPKDQPAVYARMLEEGRAAGHDVSKLPQAWDPSVPAILRYHRSTAIPVNDWFKENAALERKKTAPGKAGGAGTGSDEVWGGAPGPQSSAAPPIGGPVIAEATPPEPVPALGSGAPGDQPPGTAPMPAGPEAAPPPVAAPVAPVAPPAGAPAGFQPMGHRDPQGNLVPALMDGKPVFRNVQTGKLTSNPQAAAPAEPVPALSSGGTGEQGPGGGLPPGPMVAQVTPPKGGPNAQGPPGPPQEGGRYSPKIVYDSPAVRGGVYGERPGLHGQKEKITGPAGGSIFKMPDGTFEEWNPHLKKPQSSDIGITPENENLRGDEFVATLPAGDRNIVNGLIGGTLLLSDLSKRAQDYNRYLALAKQADPSFDPTPGGARRRFEQQFMTNGQGGQTMLAANTAVDHMKTYRDLVDGLNNGNTQMLNGALNAIRRQFGDAAATNPEAAKTVLATEIAKAVRGAGALNEQEEKDYQKILSTSQSPAQFQGTLDTLTNLMMGRVHALEDRAKAMGVPDARVNEYLSPRARDALEYIKKNPIGAGKEPPGLLDRIGSALGGGSTPPAPATAAPAAIQDGVTATNPQTGQKIIRKGGQWVPAQ